MTDQIQKKTKVLLELRPGFEGYAGIPQETRLLFRGLRLMESLDVEGMLQTSVRFLAKGTPNTGKTSLLPFKMTEARKLNRYSRVIISTAEKPYRTYFDKLIDWTQKGLATASLAVLTMLCLKKIRMTEFKSEHFKDFVWRTLFSKTLPARDFEVVAAADMKVCSVPWNTMHMVGLSTLNVLIAPRYPHLDTTGIDIFISQTPYPARISRTTALIVRYHDAIPVFMPHTISDKSVHQATHFYALMENVKSGAYFACVSDATRRDLLKLYPQVEKRSITIHNMVSHHYYQEDSSFERVPGIIRSRLHADFEKESKEFGLTPRFFTLREQENFYRRCLNPRTLKYLLVVSTIEPRKNHARLLAAWEVLKAEVDPAIKLVIVGTLGWDYGILLQGLRSWIDRGEVFLLRGVPSPDLRVLYRHAMATICPSLGEGFDFSGIESMRSGGVTIASDIPVHREVYDDATEYFDPYSTISLVKSIRKVLYDPDAEKVQEKMRIRGKEVSSRYLPEIIFPKWDQFLKQVMVEKNSNR